MQKTIEQIFENNINRLIKKLNNCKIVVAYSGGIDSSVLLDLFIKIKEKYKLKIFVAYVNHNLRGEESIKEYEFVTNQLKKLNLKFFVKDVPPSYWQNIKAKSIEMAARELRYNFFQEICKTEKLNYIATAHHFIDRIETFFLNLIRGTGIDALKAIPMKNRNIIRPLLNISKKEIEEYAKKNNLEYIIDSSNYTNIYKRNIVRNQLLPVVKLLKEDYEKSFKHIFSFLEEEAFFIKKYIKHIFKKITTFKSKAIIVIDKKNFDKKSIFIKKEIVKYILTKINCKIFQNISLFKLLKNKRIVYNKRNLIVNSKLKFLYFINKKFLTKLDEILIKELVCNIKNNNLNIELFEDENIDYKKNLVFNKEMVILPLIIRNLKDDDTILISGKEKNIKRLLKKDIGIPDILIPYTIVLQNSNKEIIAFLITNIFRISEKYYVLNNNKKLVLKISPLS